MANLPEAAVWEPGIFQIETDTIAMGGPDGASNLQARQLANRTLFLATAAQTLGNDLRDVRDRTEALEDGVRRIRAVADIAALGALEAEAGEVALVPGCGVYRYDPDSSRDESLPWVVESSHGGRWEHTTADLVLPDGGGEYPAHGLAKLDAAGRVPAAAVRYGIVALPTILKLDEATETFAVPGTEVWTDVPGGSGTLGELQVGDIVEITGLAIGECVTGARGVWWRLVLRGPGGDEVVGGGDGIEEGSDTTLTVVVRLEVQAAGLHQVVVQAAIDEPDTTFRLRPGTALFATVFRP